MLEEERCDLESQVASTTLELSDHESALKAAQLQLAESEGLRRELEAAATAWAALAVVNTNDGDDATVSSNVSSLASFVTAGGAMSPGLTPRSERENEDVVAYFEGVVRELKEENRGMRERAKKERRRRKEAEEDFAAKLSVKDQDVLFRDRELEGARGELERMRELVAKTNSLVAELRSGRREETMRAREVVMNAGSRASSPERGGRKEEKEEGKEEKEEETEEEESRRKRREVQRAWNNSPASEQDKGGDRRREGGEKPESTSDIYEIDTSAPLPPPLPIGEPPKRRGSHDRQWLDAKLQRMGVRSGSGGGGDEGGGGGGGGGGEGGGGEGGGGGERRGSRSRVSHADDAGEEEERREVRRRDRCRDRKRRQRKGKRQGGQNIAVLISSYLRLLSSSF